MRRTVVCAVLPFLAAPRPGHRVDAAQNPVVQHLPGQCTFVALGAPFHSRQFSTPLRNASINFARRILSRRSYRTANARSVTTASRGRRRARPTPCRDANVVKAVAPRVTGARKKGAFPVGSQQGIFRNKPGAMFEITQAAITKPEEPEDGAQ